MSNPEEMLVQLINSINKLSTLVQNVNDSMDRLSSQITKLEEKMAGFSSVETQVSEVGLKLGEIPVLKDMISNLGSKIDTITPVPSKSKKKKAPAAVESTITEEALAKKTEEYVSPGTQEEPEAVDSTEQADSAFNAVSKKFKHISQMVTPQSSCGNIQKLLEELRDEVETQVGMSPMLYELNSWVKRISKMPEGDILLPDVHTELIEKLDDWLTRVTKAIHLKYTN
ncbi:MAG: hypothetical protein KAS63_06165 [Candidatus Heimdallarchaeota archaeon]|nr:hypothetical protein [Candidatus Heimdallarchaeota archaeon]MCK4954926.1 hypothetical protein [Candidatus Heimdallarchaeota archaeon]